VIFFLFICFEGSSKEKALLDLVLNRVFLENSPGCVAIVDVAENQSQMQLVMPQ